MLERVRRREAELRSRDEISLETFGRDLRDRAPDLERVTDAFALACVAAARTLGLIPFDVQVLGGLVMHEGKIAEMQTGEGKTLTAVLPVFANALDGTGVHVWTANDYLARRDAQWMGPLYRSIGVSVGFVNQGMDSAERRAAYACDVTYAPASEVGFDLLRDNMSLHPSDLRQRGFAFALIDEIDSILIDEARLPLVIAGEDSASEQLTKEMAAIVTGFSRNVHYSIDEYARNVQLTDLGTAVIEERFGCENLFEVGNLGLLAAAQDAVHVAELLRRDVDYVVKNGAIESIDEFKGRIAQNRRWPGGLQTALEAKEGLTLNKQGRILGSITLQYLASLYQHVCGMTGTASTQWEEFRQIYNLEVVVVPTNRPMIRVDRADKIFATKLDKENALVEEILRVHSTGQPVLIGTASVEESERLSAAVSLAGVRHEVLNAKNDEAEAAIVARAGQSGQVTISTNMAGRGTDILLGPGVAALGGLCVVGTNRHEARRIDHQLRGRAGRQGDPGSSQFFVSLEDDLSARYGIRESLSSYSADPGKAIAHVQRIIEGQNLEIRRTLWKYEYLVEQQRRTVYQWRMKVMVNSEESLLERNDPKRFAELQRRLGDDRLRELERLITLAKIDELWSEYLTALADLRRGVLWVSLSGQRPLGAFMVTANAMFRELERRIEEEIMQVLRNPRLSAQGEVAKAFHRGATWTYLINDQIFGTMQERRAKAIALMLRKVMGRGKASGQREDSALMS